MTMDKELKIWAAGAFDGEGSALIEKTGVNSYQITVAVSNTNPKMTNPIMEAWGGHHRANQDVNKFHKDGSKRLSKNGSERSMDYSVYFSRDEAKRFLADIYPYLRVYRDNVLIVLKALYAIPGEEELSGAGKTRAPRGATKALEPYYQQLQGIRRNH